MNLKLQLTSKSSRFLSHTHSHSLFFLFNWFCLNLNFDDIFVCLFWFSVEYNVSYVYHAMFAYFDRDNVALRGHAK